jgi:hypothetical protein
MDVIYVLCVNGAEWEDIVVYLSKEEALEKSKKWPNTRMEIFSKSEKGGYRPTYNYYLNGILVETT